MDLALVVDPEMLDEGVIEGGLAESGEARHLAFMAEGQESQGLGGIGIGLAQAVDAPGPLQLRLAAIELGQLAVPEEPHGILHIVAPAIGGIEQRLGPAGMEEAGERMGEMVIAEGDRGGRGEIELALEALAVEHGGGIRPAIADAFVLHVFMALAAEPPAKLEGDVSPRRKMAEETGGKHAPGHGHGADLRALAPGDGQAFVDGLDRYAPAVALLAGDALQRHRRQHPILIEQAGAGIVAAGIDAENKHGEGFRPLAGLAIGEPNLTPNGPRRNGFLAADVPLVFPP